MVVIAVVLVVLVVPIMIAVSMVVIVALVLGVMYRLHGDIGRNGRSFMVTTNLMLTVRLSNVVIMRPDGNSRRPIRVRG